MEQPTLEEFKAWVATKNPDETYNYVNPGDCAFAQFLREVLKLEDPRCDFAGWSDGSWDRNPMPRDIEWAVRGGRDPGDDVYTFRHLAKELNQVPEELIGTFNGDG